MKDRKLKILLSTTEDEIRAIVRDWDDVYLTTAIGGLKEHAARFEGALDGADPADARIVRAEYGEGYEKVRDCIRIAEEERDIRDLIRDLTTQGGTDEERTGED